MADGELLIDQKNSLLYWKDSSGVINSLNLKSSAQTSAQLISILGYTPYNGTTNPNGYLTSVSQAAVLSALGFIPANNASLGTAATKNVGTAANNILQLDANGKIPAVDGSQLTNINGGTGLIGFRQLFINGLFSIDQRNNGTSVSTPNNYTVDRWAISSAAGTYTVQRTGSPGSYALVITATSAITNLSVYQRIEALNIANSTGSMTLSVTMSASTAFTSYWQSYYPTARDNYTSVIMDKSGNWSVSTIATRYSSTFVPTSVANGYAINIIGSATNPVNLAAGQSITISNAQFEVGSAATAVEIRPYGFELALCQRYYANYGSTAYAGYTQGNARVAGVWPVTMRTAPTVTYGSNSQGGTITVDAVGWTYPQPAQFNVIQIQSASAEL